MLWVAPLLLLSSPLDVAWDAPEGCPDAAAFEQRVLAEADVEPTNDAASARVRVRVTIRQRGSEDWILSIELEHADARDRRELVGTSCEGVVEAAVVLTSMRVVELVVETDVLVPEPRSPSEPRPAPPVEPDSRRPTLDPPTPDPEPPPVEPPSEAPGRRPRRAPEPGAVLLRAAGGVAYGVLPGVGAAVELGLGYEGDRWRVGLSGRGAPTRRAEHDTVAGVGGRFDLVGGQLDVCWAPTVGPVVLPLCGLLEAGGLRGVGRGDGAVVRWSPWLGLGGSLAAVWRVSRFIAPRIALEGLGSLVRPGFVAGAAPGTLFEAGSGGLRAMVGLEVRLQIGPRNQAVAQTP